MINIGKLDRIITIMRRTETKDGPNVVSAWTEIATLWAEVLQNAADEDQTGYGEAQLERITLRTRYFPDLTTADQLVFEGCTFNLKGITELGRRQALELRAVAVS